LTTGGTDGVWDIAAFFLWFGLFSQMCLVSFPAGTPAGVPAPKPRHQGFGIGFSLFPPFSS
jgi:hypothetical protein